MSKLDPNTGLPELPEGYFWRIKANKNEFISSPYKITIRERIWGIFTEEVDYEFCYERTLLSTAHEMAYAFSLRNARLSLNKSLLGDYPPKKLVIND